MLPLPSLLYPRMGTKGFKFWLRCSSRGTQAGGPMSLVWVNTCTCAHLLSGSHSAADRRPQREEGDSVLRGSPNGSLDGLTSFYRWGVRGLYVSGSREMEGVII